VNYEVFARKYRPQTFDDLVGQTHVSRTLKNAVAQNRLARILATGRGLPADPIAATKWHTIAKAGGASDIWLENYMQQIKDNERAAGENAARLWLAHAKPNS